MGRDANTPSESEWRIMEVIWEQGDGITSSRIVELLLNSTDMSERTIRVLLSRLCGKGLLSYTVDERDARIYHYRAERDREACLKEKTRSFVDSYFKGNGAGAIASFIGESRLTGEQIKELEALLDDKGSSLSDSGEKNDE